jgi:hypothetical protein
MGLENDLRDTVLIRNSHMTKMDLGLEIIDRALDIKGTPI